MDLESYYSQYIENIDSERILIKSFSTLMSPSQSERHELTWSEREKEEDMELLKLQGEKLDNELYRIEEDIRLRQLDIANAKKSHLNRMSQIERLSHLSQPVDLDHTYFFINRQPMRTKENSPPKVHSSQKNYHLQSGETILLEGRLDEITTALQKRFIHLDEVLSSVRYEGQMPVLSHTLFEESSSLVNKIEKSDRQLFANITDTLRLRLLMSTSQRTEAEERCQTQKERLEHHERSRRSSIEHDKSMKQMTSDFQVEIVRSTDMYEKQLLASKKKLCDLEERETEAKAEELVQQLTEKAIYAKQR
jgi:hypothetical protein